MSIEGAHVRLRPIQPADVDTLYRWYEDPDLVAPYDAYAHEPYPDFVASFRSADRDSPDSLGPRFGIERIDTGELVGCVGYYRGHPVLDYWDVWYLIGEPAARGRGYGREAVGLLVGERFRTTSVERVGAVCDPENAASVKLLEGLGLRLEGTLRSVLYHHARWHDARVYGITRSEWDDRARAART